MSETSHLFPNLFSPLKVGGVSLKNRVVRTAHGTNYPDPYANERLIAYHEARAANEVALTILEPASVHPTSPGRFRVWDDGAIPAYQALTQRISPYGMKIFQQLWHGGAHSPSSRAPAWSASAVPSIENGNVPQEMTREMIHEIVSAYVAAAKRCEQGGLDGVEVHAGHGYLISQFLSPLTNLRADEYGGSAENRARFLLEIMRGIRESVAADFTVGVRLSSTEAVDGGFTTDDTKELAAVLVEESLIDFLDLSLGSFYSSHKIVGAMHEPTGYQLPYSKEISENVKVPTIVAGRITNLSEAEAVIASGTADLVSMVRATIADPELVTKTTSGRTQEVRPCIGCNQGCIGGIYGPRHRLGCTVNVAVGDESRAHPTQVARPKRILVIGGGPAGMEAARVARLRGHKVELHEAESSLGGQTLLARRAPLRSDFGRFCDWQERELSRIGVEVHLNSTISPESLASYNADVVAVATGAVPDLTGRQRHRPHVPVDMSDSSTVLSIYDIFEEIDPVTESYVVFDDLGHYPAVGAAEHLLQAGKTVLFVTTHSRVGGELGVYFQRDPAISRLLDFGERFQFVTRHELTQIDGPQATLRSMDNSKSRTVTADAVVLATAFRAHQPFDPTSDAKELRVLGDAAAPRDLQIAIAEGSRFGAEV